MAAVAREIGRRGRRPLGINVLRSDGRSALAVAVAAGARFIRVNVHVGAVLTDQGIIQGAAHELLRARRLLGADVRILADVQTKHAAPLARRPARAGGARLRRARARRRPHRLRRRHRRSRPRPATSSACATRRRIPLLVGAGATAETAAELLAVADGLIVGTAVKRDGVVGHPVDAARVRRLVDGRPERVD